MSFSPQVGRDLRRNMPALTILRAFLAWWVVAFHAAPLYPFGLDQHSPFLGCGVVCVDCFFVLSGFVLFNAHPILLDAKRSNTMGRFFLARFARIYPLHFVMLCAFVLLILGTRLAGMHLNDPSGFTLRALVKQLLLLNGSVFPDGRSWNYPSWSVGAEALAYLAAPIVFVFVSRLPRVAVLPVMLACCLATVGLTGMNILTRSGMIPCRVLLEFSLGAMMCRVAQQFHDPLLKIRAVALPLGLLAAAGFTSLSDHGPFLAAMLWVIGFLSLRSTRYAGLAGRIEAVWVYLGETSFAVYLCHAFVLTLWAGAMSRVEIGLFGHRLPVAILLCLVIQAMAMSLNRLVEVPAGRWIRTSWSGHRTIPAIALRPEPAELPI